MAAAPVFTADIGTPCVWAARYLRMNGTRRLFDSFSHGCVQIRCRTRAEPKQPWGA